jgi:hypothetical protein
MSLRGHAFWDLLAEVSLPLIRVIVCFVIAMLFSCSCVSDAIGTSCINLCGGRFLL